jgi:hypothetical protein
MLPKVVKASKTGVAKLLTLMQNSRQFQITNFANVNVCVFMAIVWHDNVNDSDVQQTRYVLSLDTLGSVT